MKNKRLHVRLTDNRYYKLMNLAIQTDRTISSLVDEWIDSLKLENGDSSITPKSECGNYFNLN